jgi:hypothetical protein
LLRQSDECLEPIVLQNPATDFVFTTTCIASEKRPIRGKRESPIRVPETQSTFHPRATKRLPVVAMCVGNAVVKAEDVSPTAVKLALLDSTFPISMK